MPFKLALGDGLAEDIKSMQLYPRADRIYRDLEALGFDAQASLPIETVNQFDQLHYHGTDALDAAIEACGMSDGQDVLEVGSGWGGCARYLANSSGASVTAVELQKDYHDVACDLTQRVGPEGVVNHVNADFLELELPENGFDHAVSWLALFHIPDRQRYLRKISAALRDGGTFFGEDLYLIQEPDEEEAEDFRKHLFPNSLVDRQVYIASMEETGFDLDSFIDMTQDWTNFTRDRLAGFHANRAQYEAVHSAQGYETIETFYAKMASYFERGLVGGVRFAARARV
ncbi:MAG: class I SAM-dependent methyltransferase [Pseudomonadota bacterium]